MSWSSKEMLLLRWFFTQYSLKTLFFGISEENLLISPQQPGVIQKVLLPSKSLVLGPAQTQKPGLSLLFVPQVH